MNNKTLEKINECQRDHSEELDLSGCNLKEIPDEVCGLTWLTTLDINSNQITDVGPLKSLTALTDLTS